MSKVIERSPLLVILGPTASGKSQLAMELAGKFDGEIICADSRTAYRYTDIGTAKPQRDDMLQIKHHLLDIKNPDESFSASEFKDMAEKCISTISEKGKLPIMAGGSGLYIDSVLFDYQFPPIASPEKRAELEAMPLADLTARLEQADPEAAVNVDIKNRRRLIRAIETAGQPKTRANRLRPQTLVLGITMDKNVIQNRISKRAEFMLSKGLFFEVKQLAEQYGWDAPGLSAPAYKAFKGAVLGQQNAQKSLAQFIALDAALAKRQMTWFKRNPHIQWLDGADPAELNRQAGSLVERFLAE
jgi:tRNA dimethylallyltransferase